jgi:hypothetical protein
MRTPAFYFDVRLPNCSICNEPLELKTSKTDENGKAVHEDCPQDAAEGNHTPAQSLLNRNRSTKWSTIITE